MKVMITGANGQVGKELQRTAPKRNQVFAFDRKKLDVTSLEAARNAVSRCMPDIIINAAAYTAVDRAEKEPELAFAVNADGARNIATVCQENNATLVHISTDFVFSGEKSSPYEVKDTTDPISVYGKSKLAGEQYVVDVTAHTASVIRTCWIYSIFGNNFVKTMLNLMRKGKPLSVVSDQYGTPTWASGFARAVWQHIEGGAPAGIYHWTYHGVASWYDLAVAIQEEAHKRNLLEVKVPIRPVTTAEYRTAARRPAYSVLSVNLGSHKHVEQSLWRDGLCEMLDELAHQTKLEMEH